MQVKGNSKKQVEDVQEQTQEELYQDIDPVYLQLKNLYDIIEEVDPFNVPTLATLESWKNQHGDIFISTVVSPNKYYLFRVLKRAEYKKMSKDGILNDPTSIPDVIVEKCLLYPSPSQIWRLAQPAGVIDTLSKQIQYQSGFISEQEALSFIKVI